MPPSSPCRSLSVLMLQHNPALGDIPSGFLLGRPASFSRARTAGELFPRARTAGELLPRADGRRAAPTRGRPASSSPARGRLARSSPRADGRRAPPSRAAGRRDPPSASTAGEILHTRGRPATWRGCLVLHDPLLDDAPAPSRLLCVLEPGHSPRAAWPTDELVPLAPLSPPC